MSYFYTEGDKEFKEDALILVREKLVRKAYPLLSVREKLSTSHHPRVVACQCGSFVFLAKSSNCSVWCW